MAKPKNKRFYKEVSVAAVADGFHVLLDGRILKTPGKVTLLVPTQKAAYLIAAEWQAQGEEIDPMTMPVTRLLNVAVEQTPKNRVALIAEARKYAETDVLCYREGEVRLQAEYQAKNWDPILAWAEARGISLKVTQALAAIAQSETSLNKVAAYASDLSDMSLTLYLHLTSVFGSAILAMAVLEKHISPERGYELSRLDELWQIKYWGEDEIAKERTEAITEEVIALCRLLED